MTTSDEKAGAVAPVDGRWDAPPGGLHAPAADVWPARTAGIPLSRSALVHASIIVVALGGWVVALRGTELSRISGYGLLSALPPSYFVALGLLAGGYGLAASRRSVPPAVLGAYVVTLVVVLHATTAVLYPEPRYAWTYKHVGVIDYLVLHGSADRTIDIYHNWPGFFALTAWFSSATGIPALSYAAWAQVAFGLANVAVVRFALGGVTDDERLRWTAVWIFVVANWIAQDYLAPQAFGFVLVQVVLALVVRCGPVAVRRTRGGRAWQQRVERIAAGVARDRPQAPFRPATAVSTRVALVTCGLCALAVIVGHQLSPVMLILSLGALAVTTGRPPVWALAALVAIEAWWLYLSYDFVSTHFRLFSLDLAATARPAVPSLPGAALGVNASRAAMVLLVLLAACGVVRRLRAGYLDAGALTLAAAPTLTMALQAYGGEAPLRAYLFALPWLAFFVAAACHGTTVRAAWRVFCVTVVLGAGTLFGYFGQEMVNVMGRDDVAASRWWLDHSPPGASLTLVAPNFPSRLNARYAEHLDSPPSLVEAPGFRPHRLGARDVPTLEALLRRNGAPARYVALSPSGARYARFYGLAPAGSFERLARVLEEAPRFRLVYRRGAASIFEYVPAR